MMYDADMYSQLLSLLDATTYTDFSRYFDAEKGIVGKLYGFNILLRSTCLRYTNATPGAKKSPAASGATTDMGGCLFWHESFVERAIGDTKIFEHLQDPTYYGDIYSLLIMAGGRAVDTNNVGVGAIVQAVY